MATDLYFSIYIAIKFSTVCTSDFGRIEHLKILLTQTIVVVEIRDKNKSAFILYIYFLHKKYI